MAIANIIASGIGFNPGSVKFIPTRGFIAGTVIVPPPVGPGSSGGRGVGRVWAWQPEVSKRTKPDWNPDRDERLKKLLARTLKRKKRQKELERIAKIAAENAHGAMDIRKASENLEREILTMSRLKKISEKERIRKIHQLREEEEIIVAILLMEL